MSTIDFFRTATSNFASENIGPLVISLYSIKQQALNDLSTTIHEKAPTVFSCLQTAHKTLQTPIYKEFTPAIGLMCATAAYAGLLSAAVPFAAKQNSCRITLAIITAGTICALASVALAKNPQELVISEGITLSTFTICAMSLCCKRALI